MDGRGYAIVSATIKKYAYLLQIRSQDEMAHAVGMTRGTFRSRMQSPHTWSLGELVSISEQFGIPAEELLGGVFPNSEKEERRRKK